MECGSAKRTKLAAVEAAKEAHVYPLTLDPGQVAVTEQLIFAGECATEAAAAERALMMTAQAAGDVKVMAMARRLVNGEKYLFKSRLQHCLRLVFH